MCKGRKERSLEVKKHKCHPQVLESVQFGWQPVCCWLNCHRTFHFWTLIVWTLFSKNSNFLRSQNLIHEMAENSEPQHESATDLLWLQAAQSILKCITFKGSYIELRKLVIAFALHFIIFVCSCAFNKKTFKQCLIKELINHLVMVLI